MKLFKKQPVHVIGNVLKIGDHAPNFKATNNQLEDVSLDNYTSDYIIINVIPSLDTSVCTIQSRTINTQLSALKDTTILTLSNDLPFAQKRWCGQEGLDNMITLSDYKYLDFAYKYGVLIEEHRLLARSVFVLDAARKIIYAEYVDNMSLEPNYEALFKVLESRGIK